MEENWHRQERMTYDLVKTNNLMAQMLSAFIGNGRMRPPMLPPGPVRMRGRPGSEGLPG